MAFITHKQICSENILLLPVACQVNSYSSTFNINHFIWMWSRKGFVYQFRIFLYENIAQYYFEKMVSIKKNVEQPKPWDSKPTKVRKLNTHIQLSFGLSAPILNGHIDPEEDMLVEGFWEL